MKQCSFDTRSGGATWLPSCGDAFLSGWRRENRKRKRLWLLETLSEALWGQDSSATPVSSIHLSYPLLYVSDFPLTKAPLNEGENEFFLPSLRPPVATMAWSLP